MAERLTEKDSIENKRYVLNSEDNQIILTSAKLKNGFRKTYYYGKPIEKLAQFEDIMEEHDFNTIEDLQDFLNYTEKIIKEYKQVKNDRDTWQKACELACEREDDCYVYDNIHRAYEFYQQAKKEGNINK